MLFPKDQPPTNIRHIYPANLISDSQTWIAGTRQKYESLMTKCKLKNQHSLWVVQTISSDLGSVGFVLDLERYCHIHRGGKTHFHCVRDRRRVFSFAPQKKRHPPPEGGLSWEVVTSPLWLSVRTDWRHGHVRVSCLEITFLPFSFCAKIANRLRM